MRGCLVAPLSLFWPALELAAWLAAGLTWKPLACSFMSGRRPDTTRVWNFMDHFREEGVGADWLSM